MANPLQALSSGELDRLIADASAIRTSKGGTGSQFASDLPVYGARGASTRTPNLFGSPGEQFRDSA